MKMWIGYIGAFLGAFIAYYVVLWGAERFLNKGHYFLLLTPGILVGLLGTVFLQRRSFSFGLICAAVALVQTVFLTWKTMPFPTDDSLSFFVRNFGALAPMVPPLIIGSAVAAFILGWGLLSNASRLEDDN